MNWEIEDIFFKADFFNTENKRYRTKETNKLNIHLYVCQSVDLSNKYLLRHSLATHAYTYL